MECINLKKSLVLTTQVSRFSSQAKGLSIKILHSTLSLLQLSYHKLATFTRGGIC